MGIHYIGASVVIYLNIFHYRKLKNTKRERKYILVLAHKNKGPKRACGFTKDSLSAPWMTENGQGHGGGGSPWPWPRLCGRQHCVALCGFAHVR